MKTILIKVLHITECAGGVETHILHLLRYLNRDEYCSTLLCSTDGSLAQNAALLDVDVRVIELVGKRIHATKDLKALLAVYSFIRRGDFDIVHTHSSKGGFIGRLAAKLAGHKMIIYTPHAFFYLRFRGIRRWFFLLLERVARYWTHVLIATSASEALRARYDVRFHADRIRVIYNSVDIEIRALLAGNRRTNSGPSLMFVGRLDHQKNPEMFVRVSSIVHEEAPDVKYTMLGFGQWDGLGNETRSKIREYELMDDYDFIDWLPRDRALEMISRCTLLVGTSRYESFGYVAAEAMALGRPVVATNVDGLRDVILHGETGYLVDLDDDETMAAYILRLLQDEHLRRKMGDAARERVKAIFNIENNIKQVEEVYRNAVRSHR